jgi:hypothetical protein
VGSVSAHGPGRAAGADVAVRLEMKVYTVLKAKSKVQKMLQEEVASLDGP